MGLIYAACLILNKQPVPLVIENFGIFVGVGNLIYLLWVFPFIIYLLRKKQKIDKTILLFNTLASLVSILGAFIVVGSSGSTWFEVNIDHMVFGMLLLFSGTVSRK